MTPTAPLPLPDRPTRRWPGRVAGALLIAGLACAVSLAAVAVVVATSGVFSQRPRAWTVALHPLPGVTVQANVNGLLRLATSPLGLRLLDGHSRTTVLGHLRFTRDGDALRVRCSPCRIRHEALAPSLVALPPLELRVSRRDGVENNNRLEGSLTTAGVAVKFDAEFKGEGVELAWQLPSSEIAHLIRILAEAIPEARYARLQGRVRATGTLALPAFRLDAEVRMQDVEVGGLDSERLRAGWFAHACPQQDDAAPGDGQQRLSGEGEKGWTALADSGAWLAAAVVAARDPQFGKRLAVDLPARVAGVRLLEADTWEVRQGLAQQLAATLLGPGPVGASRRVREWLHAVEMERTLEAGRILELHLNTAVWGPGLCGAQAAARAYFNKRVAALTPLEAAWLAGALQAPYRMHERQFARGRGDLQAAHALLNRLPGLTPGERLAWQRRPLTFAERRAGRPRAAAEPAARVRQPAPQVGTAAPGRSTAPRQPPQGSTPTASPTRIAPLSSTRAVMPPWPRMAA